MESRHLFLPMAMVKRKKTRVVMTLRKKVEILDKLRTGMSVASVAREYVVNESTIRSIRHSEAKIRASIAASAPISAKISQVCRRDPVLEKMETMLSSWIENSRILLTDHISIRDKALEYYHNIANQNGVHSNMITFQASKGWFENFKKRFGLGNFKKTTHTQETSISQDTKANFNTEFVKIEDVEFSPEQINGSYPEFCYIDDEESSVNPLQEINNTNEQQSTSPLPCSESSQRDVPIVPKEEAVEIEEMVIISPKNSPNYEYHNQSGTDINDYDTSKQIYSDAANSIHSNKKYDAYEEVSSMNAAVAELIKATLDEEKDTVKLTQLQNKFLKLILEIRENKLNDIKTNCLTTVS